MQELKLAVRSKKAALVRNDDGVVVPERLATDGTPNICGIPRIGFNRPLAEGGNSQLPS